MDESKHIIDVYCQRDRRFKVVEPKSQEACTVNTYVSRTVYALPISGMLSTASPEHYSDEYESAHDFKLATDHICYNAHQILFLDASI